MESTSDLRKAIQEEALLITVVSGTLLTLPWRYIYVNDEGYLFAPDENGEPVWVQLVNWQWREDLMIPEA